MTVLKKDHDKISSGSWNVASYDEQSAKWEEMEKSGKFFSPKQVLPLIQSTYLARRNVDGKIVDAEAKELWNQSKAVSIKV